jgi:hypothetical protein
MNFPRRFLFHSSAMGVAARLRRPTDQTLPVHAASTLPVTGGHSESKSGPGKLGDLLHFESAETSAHGDFVDQSAAEAMTRGAVPFDSVGTHTTVTARVRGLHVGKRFSIGVADAGLDSHHAQDGTHPSIRLAGNRLDQIRVDDSILKVTINEDFFNEHDTLAKLEAGFAKGLPESHSKRFFFPDDNRQASTLPISNGLAFCTIVEKMEWEGKEHPTAKIDHNLLYIPDFGRVYFGVMSMSTHSRRLTLVRIQLGSPDGGDISVSEVDDNGLTWPA